MTEDEMVGWHHQLNGHEFEQALGDCEGQGSLECCSLWGRTELDMTVLTQQQQQQQQQPGYSEGQGSLVCCSPQGGKELDTTE